MTSISEPPANVSAIDLERYASEATLPLMYFTRRSPHRSTQRSPNDGRNLKSVHPVSKADFFDRVTSYYKARPPSNTQTSERKWSLRVPHENYPAVQSAGVLNPENERGVQTWVEQVALQTALCLARSAEPELTDLEFGTVSGPGTQKARSDVVFRMGNPRGRETASQAYSLLVEVKCPWTLSYSDMHGISGMWNEISLATSSRPKRYNKALSVLAQVYDYCTAQGHCFWIITTYEYWTFGVFSENYETAMVTEPIRYDSRSPTVLQCILYWIQSATFRPGAFEIPKAIGFRIPCSRSLWKETLRIWRDNGLQELGPRFTQAGYNDPDWSFAKCIASLDERNLSVNSASPRSDQDLQDACWEVLEVLGRPRTRREWTVVLTWLALLLDPISATSELPCLESAYAAAFRKVARQPGYLHFGVREQTSPSIRRGQGRVGATAPTIWKVGIALNPVESLKEFLWSHASHEVAFILDRYLPRSIRDWLEQRLVKVQLLSTAPQGPQLKGSGVDNARYAEGTTSRIQGITERTRSERPSSGTSPNVLQGAIDLWQNNIGSGNTAGPSSTPKSQGARPSAYFAYRTNSDAAMASPVTPITSPASGGTDTRRPRNAGESGHSAMNFDPAEFELM